MAQKSLAQMIQMLSDLASGYPQDRVTTNEQIVKQLEMPDGMYGPPVPEQFKPSMREGVPTLQKAKQLAQGVYGQVTGRQSLGNDWDKEDVQAGLAGTMGAITGATAGLPDGMDVDLGSARNNAAARQGMQGGMLAGMAIPMEGPVAAGRGLYSRLDDAFKLIPDKPMHPNAVLNLLKKAPGGVSTEEMAHRGVPEFLAGYGEKPVPRAALAAHLDAHPAPVPKISRLGQSTDPAHVHAARNMVESGYTQGESLPALQSAYPDATAAELRNAWTAAIDPSYPKGSPKYAQYQVPGGENYRETLLTLPDRPNNSYEEVITRLEKKYGEGFDTDVLTPAEQAEKSSAWDRINASSGGYRESEFRNAHFPDDPNLLLHTRANDRTIREFGRGRFLEEVQSDWHQAGKQKGYGVRPNDVAIEQWLRDAGGPVKRQGDKWFFKALGEYKEAVGATSMDEARSAQRNFAIKSLDGIAQTGVPDAPFKDSWPELGLKQQLLEASDDPDVNWIGFTSGKTQADRYDLSKQVDSIEIRPRMRSGEKSRSLLLKMPNDRVMSLGVNNQGIVDSIGASNSEMQGKRLSDVLGKEISERIMGTDGSATLSGLDLQVGGQGMTEFYDKKLPARMNKIVKPFGGKVERVAMDGENEAWIVRLTPEMKREILKAGFPLLLGVGAVGSTLDGGR